MHLLYVSNLLLNRYNDEIDGVPLAYSDERVVSTAAIVHPYFPLTRLTVTATLVAFRPRPGVRVVGIVNKVSEGYLGLVVLGFMNAVVRAADVRADLTPQLVGGTWASAKNPAHTIAVGDSVAFTVLRLEHSGAYVTLSGALTRRDTGNVAHVVASEKDKPKKKRKDKKEKKRRKGKGAESEAEEVEVGEDGGAAAAAEGKRKRKKSEGGGGEEEKSEKKKKKKQEEKESGKGAEKKRKKGGDRQAT